MSTSQADPLTLAPGTDSKSLARESLSALKVILMLTDSIGLPCLRLRGFMSSDARGYLLAVCVSE